ncbi:MAG: serine/threonine-protein kinase [Candidatus Melainabacteria bacterium]|mgnify:CR=1 FL=1|nr:serine/threonine-protein kinase [Candidatus Melainabacteria bacterium]
MNEEIVEKQDVVDLVETPDRDADAVQILVAKDKTREVNSATMIGDDIDATVIQFRLRKPNHMLEAAFAILAVGSIINVIWWALNAKVPHPEVLPAAVGAITLVFGFIIALFHWVETRVSGLMTLKLAEGGIQFSNHWKLELLNRVVRSWNDVQSVEIVSLAVPQKKPFLTSQYLFDAQFGTKLYIDFESGGDASVGLNLLNDQQKTELFRALSKHVPLTRFSGAAVRFKEQLLSDVSNTSYTDLWIDDISMRHASTNFEPLPCGHLLRSGNLRVAAELASGGLSAVYLVESEDRKTKLVLKESVLPLDMSEESKAKARELFHREAKLLSTLNHPNIVKVHDFFVERGRDYLLLQHIPGRTLRQVVSEGRLSESRAVDLATRVADIIKYLHEQTPPVVHRDLTPDNILVRNDGEVVLIDFGAANQFVGQATGTMVGKKSYIPPEQFRGKAQPASDIYAFGATLFFMLTGKDPIALSTSTISSDLKISEKVCFIVEKCTDLEPDQRFENIDAVVQALLENSEEARR